MIFGNLTFKMGTAPPDVKEGLHPIAELRIPAPEKKDFLLRSG
jgi:hypothetical protein